jgi:hypothetical protein
MAGATGDLAAWLGAIHKTCAKLLVPGYAQELQQGMNALGSDMSAIHVCVSYDVRR